MYALMRIERTEDSTIKQVVTTVYNQRDIVMEALEGQAEFLSETYGKRDSFLAVSNGSGTRGVSFLDYDGTKTHVYAKVVKLIAIEDFDMAIDCLR